MENKIKDFNFYNLVLAAKHWYTKSENESMYDFVVRLVRLENRFCVPKSSDNKKSAVRYCALCLDELKDLRVKQGKTAYWNSYYYLFNEIEKYKSVYDVEDDEEAFILFTFNILMMLDSKDIELPKPIYGRGYPRMRNQQGMSYAEMRRFADKVFDKK